MRPAREPLGDTRPPAGVQHRTVVHPPSHSRIFSGRRALVRPVHDRREGPSRWVTPDWRATSPGSPRKPPGLHPRSVQPRRALRGAGDAVCERSAASVSVRSSLPRRPVVRPASARRGGDSLPARGSHRPRACAARRCRLLHLGESTAHGDEGSAPRSLADLFSATDGRDVVLVAHDTRALRGATSRRTQRAIARWRCIA